MTDRKGFIKRIEDAIQKALDTAVCVDPFIEDHQEFAEYCITYADVIPITDTIDGKMVACFFKELPEERQMFWIDLWHSRKVMPIRMFRKDELNK